MHIYSIKILGENIKYKCYIFAGSRIMATRFALDALPAGFVLRAIVCELT